MITEDIDQDLLDKLPTLQKAFTKIEEQNKELHFKDEDISSKNKEIDRLKRILESNNIEYDD